MTYGPPPRGGLTYMPYYPTWPPSTTRTYRMECVSCHGSGQSERPIQGSTRCWPCEGCEGAGHVTVTETTVGG